MFGIIFRPVIAYLSRLRFPVLFVIMAAAFIINIFIPDPIPFIDEIILGLAAAVLAVLKKRKAEKIKTGRGKS